MRPVTNRRQRPGAQPARPSPTQQRGEADAPQKVPGTCCICRRSDVELWTTICLPFMAPQPGTGWGCFVCALPSNGALAALCKSCAQLYVSDKAPRPLLEALQDVIAGYPVNGNRFPLANLAQVAFRHDPAKHAEAIVSEAEKCEYRGFTLESRREQATGGWPAVYYQAIRESDGYFLIDDYTTGSDPVSSIIEGMKARVDEAIATNGASECVAPEKWIAGVDEAKSPAETILALVTASPEAAALLPIVSDILSRRQQLLPEWEQIWRNRAGDWEPEEWCREIQRLSLSAEEEVEALDMLNIGVPKARAALVTLATFAFSALAAFDAVPRCRVCGCTEEWACPGGCSWVEQNTARPSLSLCSACVEGKEEE